MIFFITLLAYWGLGLPSGILLGLTDWLHPAMGPQGFWIGIIIGLTSAAGLLGLRLRTTMHRAESGHRSLISCRITSYNVCYTKLLRKNPFCSSSKQPFNRELLTSIGRFGW